MLWQKSWWETRTGILSIMGVLIVFALLRQPWEQSDLAKWTTWLQEWTPGWSEETRRLLPLFSSYQGYVWLYWFKLVLLMMWSFCAVAMSAIPVAGSCPWVTGAAGAAGLFTYSLPVSRRKVLLTHAGLVAFEMVLAALASSLLFPIVARLIGGEISFGSIVIHALLLSLSGMVFPAFVFFLTAVFNNQWKVLVIGIAAVFALFLPLRPVEEFPWWNIYHVMSGESYFRYGQFPWLGLLVCLALSALMMFAAVRIYERRDF